MAFACAWPAAPAGADGPAGTDPTANRPVGGAPAACRTDKDSVACVNAAVADLDAARAGIGQPPYALPADFAALGAVRQVFILANLDRALYGLPPVPGVTDALIADAAAGVQARADPKPSDPSVLGSTSNWAGGFATLLYAYDGWMFDDGPGSGNGDCTAAGDPGCWGHRHDVLWSFTAPTLAMGAAAGMDPSGHAGYTLLIVAGGPSFLPAYSYTWAQAVADGAGTHAYDPGATVPLVTAPVAKSKPKAKAKRKRLAITRVRVLGHRVNVRISAPAGSHLQCSLAPVGMRPRYVTCLRTTVFRSVVPGHYTLRVRTRARKVARSVFVA